MRRIATILLLLMLATLLLAQNRVMPAGEGTAESPYEIGDMGHLLWFSDSCNKEGGNRMCAKLTGDIDVSETDAVIMLGRDVIYAGTFDGNGHSITGLNMKGNVMTPGFIGTLSSNGVVRNLIIRGSRFQGNGVNVGAICGLSGGKIVNCAVLHCSVMAKSNAGEANGMAGGICGSTTDPGVIEGCYCYIPNDMVFGIRNGAIVGENKGAVIRCFSSRMKSGDVYPVGRNDERGYLAYNEGNITDGRFASGEITYRMNDGNSSNAVMPWTQKINVEEGDLLPTFNTSTVWGVYKSQESEEEVPAGKYTTRWYPEGTDITMEGLTAYIVTELRKDTVRMQEYTETELGLVPLILYAKEKAGTITVGPISYFFNEEPEFRFDGLLKPELKGRDIVSNGSETNYVLQTQNSKQAFYRVSTDKAKAIPGADSRCYLSIKTDQHDARASSLAIATEETTGVVALTGQTAEDEQDRYVYNLRGERLRTGQMRQGEIYIRNRRRVTKQ